MSPATFVALLAVSHAVPSAPPPPPAARATVHVVDACSADVVARFDALDNALCHVQDEIEDMKGKPERREHLQEDLVQAMGEAQRARAAACSQTRVSVVERAVLLDENGARSLAGAVRREAFDDGRLAVLSTAIAGQCVTSSEARDLAAQLVFSKPRLEAVRMLAARIVDRSDAWRLFDDFTFESDKRAVREILASTPTALECTPAVLSRL